MITIIGYLKITPNEIREKYLLSSLKSLDYLQDSQVIIGLEYDDIKYLNYLSEKIKKVNPQIQVYGFHNSLSYGAVYQELLKLAKYDIILNFIEDHFSLNNSSQYISDLIETMKIYNADICKASFHKIEINSSTTLHTLLNDEKFIVFDNDLQNHNQYQKHYGSRYYIGVNFFTTKNFAKKFWNRNLGKRPHEYEISSYDESWRHICIIPKNEILCAIDDPHGEDGSHLLVRNEIKFREIYDSII